MRQVFTTAEVFHMFANNRPAPFRNNGGNVYAQGDALFSYGDHFALLARVGGRMLTNEHKYSATTNKHAYQAWRALPQHVRQSSLPVMGMRAEELRNDAGLQGIAKSCTAHACHLLEKTEKARSTRGARILEANRYLETARFLLTHTGDKKGAAKLPILTGAESVETIAAVMRSIQGAEYLKRAKDGQARATAGYARAVATLERVRAGETGFHCDFNAVDITLRDAANTLGHVASNYKQAGKAYPRACVTLDKHIKALRADIAPDCEKEYSAQILANIDRGISDAMREFYSRVRKAGIIGSGFAVSRVSEYSNNLPAGYELEKTRPHIAAFLRRRNSVAATRFAVWKGAGLVRDVETLSGSDTNIETGTARQCLSNAIDKAPGFRNSPEYRATAAAIIAAEEHNKSAAILRQKANAEKIEAWKAGARVSLPYGAGTFARIEGEEVATSLGARVPLAHAARLVKIARRVARHGGQEWKHGEGPRVGYYSVTRIGADLSAVIGCHNFTGEESSRVCDLIEKTATYTETAEG